MQAICTQIKKQGGPGYEFLPLGRAKGRLLPGDWRMKLKGDEGSDDWETGI